MKYISAVKNRVLQFLFIGCLCVLVPGQMVWAQTSGLDLEVDLSPALEMAQVLGFTSLGIEATGRGPVIFSFSMTNTNAEPLENLYFQIIVSSASRGVLAQVDQRNRTPFSMDPGERIFATNNNLADEDVPGIEESLSFDGDLTDAGTDFVNSLEGSTTLPVDLYSVQVSVFQNNNGLNGGTLIAMESVEVGGGSAGEVRDIFLKAPGDVVGTEIEITNPLPEFSWDGEVNLDYRLIVVQDNGQDSPESLLQAALSTNATNATTEGAGSLLEYENMDRIVQGINFQFPASGVKPLEQGRKYYWQLIAQIQTGAGIEARPSTIWNFTMGSTGSGGTTTVAFSDEARQAIIRLIGQDRYQTLITSGFKLDSIELDGAELTGPALETFLEIFLQKIEDEDIVVENN